MTDEAVRKEGKWAKRLILAAVVQTLLAVIVTGFLLYQGVYGRPAASRIVANGSAGMWLTVGYFAFIIFGPISMALVAGQFRQLESHLGRVATKWKSYMLWVALVLYNVGIVGGTWLMMHAGYRGGAAQLPVSAGGLGWTGAQAGLVHSQIMGVYPPYIAAFLAAALAGAMLGLVGYLLVWLRPAKAPAAARPVGTQ